MYPRKTLPNGQKNPKYVDVNDEDPPIAGQKFACMSFISPDKILKKREEFLFNQFVKQWDLTKSMEKFVDFIHFISFKYNLNADEVMGDLREFNEEEGPKLRESSVEDDFKNFFLIRRIRFRPLFEVLRFEVYFPLKRRQR